MEHYQPLWMPDWVQSSLRECYEQSGKISAPRWFYSQGSNIFDDRLLLRDNTHGIINTEPHQPSGIEASFLNGCDFSSKGYRGFHSVVTPDSNSSEETSNKLTDHGPPRSQRRTFGAVGLFKFLWTFL
jgi:hypothetical protein